MTRSLRKIVVLAFAVLTATGAQALHAQFCNWEAEAAADVFGGLGNVTSSHFGKITRVDCTNSRNVWLRANTLVNGGLFWTWDVVGGPAILGAYATYEIGFSTCSGTWSSSTQFGTVYLGYKSIYARDTSGLLFATCPPDPAPGPGPGCSAATGETSTWSLDAGHGASLEARPLDFTLTRNVDRPEGQFLMGDWAVVSTRDGASAVKLTSSDAFKQRVEQEVAAGSLSPREEGTRLLVQAPIHPHNSRYIPTPAFVPFQAPVAWQDQAPGDEFWFRAEVSTDGAIDHLRILDSSDPLGVRAVRRAIRENLRLRFQGEKRHRVVVYGRAEVLPDGDLSAKDAVVIVPACCCGESFCV